MPPSGRTDLTPPLPAFLCHCCLPGGKDGAGGVAAARLCHTPTCTRLPHVPATRRREDCLMATAFHSDRQHHLTTLVGPPTWASTRCTYHTATTARFITQHTTPPRYCAHLPWCAPLVATQQTWLAGAPATTRHRRYTRTHTHLPAACHYPPWRRSGPLPHAGADLPGTPMPGSCGDNALCRTLISPCSPGCISQELGQPSCLPLCYLVRSPAAPANPTPPDVTCSVSFIIRSDILLVWRWR